MPKLPVSPMKVASLVGEVHRAVQGPAGLLVLGTNAEAVEKVRGALAGRFWQAAGKGRPPLESVVFKENGGLPREAFSGRVAVDVLVASKAELDSVGFKDGLVELSRKNKPVVVVLRQAPGLRISFSGVGPNRVVGMSLDGAPPVDVLAEAVVDAAGDAAIALAARLPSLREEACRQIVKKAARQNAVIGSLFIIPGADMPVMTLNEARMILRLAAAHGEEVGIDRALELLGVVGAGFGFRAIARQALDFLPGPGWVIKGAVAYSGTRALGGAAKAYFNSPERLTPSRLAPLVDRIKRLRG